LTAFIALNNRRGTRFLDGTTLAAVDAWCTAHLGRDALQFCQMLTGRFSAGSLVLRAISADRLFVRARIYQAAVHIATVALRFDPLQRQAHISWFVVAPTGRGGATTRHLLQNILLIERDCGIGRTTLQAALTHGGYVWALHGFLPTPGATWAGLAGRLATKFATVAPTLTSSQAAAVEQLLRSADRRALRAIAALTIPFGATTLGKHLLMGESWDGELELSDEPSALIYLRRIGLIP
jgi:hypothetical protein